MISADKPSTDEWVAQGQARDLIQEKPNKTWRSYIWDTFDKSPEERRFLTKLDAAVLTFASLGVHQAMLLVGRILIANRVFHQVSRSEQHQQRLRVRHVSVAVDRLNKAYTRPGKKT